MRSRPKRISTADATFVFKGTIKKLGASNVKQAVISDRTNLTAENRLPTQADGAAL